VGPQALKAPHSFVKPTRLYVYLSKAFLHFTQGHKLSFYRKHYIIGF